MVVSETEPVFFDLIDPHGADCQLSCVKTFHPALGFQIPYMELHQLERFAEEAGHIVIAQSRVPRVTSTLNIQKRKQTLAGFPVVTESGTIASLGRELPLAVPVILVLNVITGTGLRVGECPVSLDNQTEPVWIP